MKYVNHCNLTKVIHSLDQQIVELTLNMHGNHVLQQFLMVFNVKSEAESSIDTHTAELYTQFIFDACIKNIITIGKHKHGCCVMQRCLEKGTWN